MASPNLLVKLTLPKPTRVYDTFWRFTAERQNIFFRRLSGSPPPWTSDPIFATHKFTNTYRASDRTSQYLIRNVIYRGDQSPEEIFFRCLLFKIFNRQSTWELLENCLGDVRCSKHSVARISEILDRAKHLGQRIFSAAYIMPSHAADFNDHIKHRNYLTLLQRMISEKVPMVLARAGSMEKAFDLLRSYPMIGNFLAYQFVTDVNYSTLTNFSEMEFVIPGPGAKNGIQKCFSSLGDLSESEVIRYVADRQEHEFAQRSLSFQTLWGRRLQLIDCQNLFCEVDKYARLAHPEFKGKSGRTRIKQRFTPNSQVIGYMFPPKWRLNPQNN